MADAKSKSGGKKIEQYRARPRQFVEPNEQELKARNKRNIAIAIGLATFMAFVFITMITRSA
ncbi:hypothetical protein [Fretibacter rubidus]|uniref:hypothetical protein n=1 Tax=Fretibacter rubidus TaxID=570162 RepID=UPI003529E52C